MKTDFFEILNIHYSIHCTYIIFSVVLCVIFSSNSKFYEHIFTIYNSLAQYA